jgi:hypothetical protein
MLKIEGVYCEACLNLITWGLDVPITIMVQRLELGEHKRLIFNFPTSLFLMVLDG